MVTLIVNGVRREVQAPDDTPLLYVLRNDLQLIGPQFGCGLAQCGACSVLVDGKEQDLGLKRDLRHGDVPLAVHVDIKGGRELTLLVDFGEGGDVGDHVNWVDVRLIR